MTDEQRQAEIDALKRIVEGHKLMIDAMLINNNALITIMEVNAALDYHKKLVEGERKPKLKVLKAL